MVTKLSRKSITTTNATKYPIVMNIFFSRGFNVYLEVASSNGLREPPSYR